jgi:gliding motility-associated-like protein
MKKIIIFLFVLLSQLIFSQGEASNWYFGGQAGIKFNPNGIVSALTDGQLVTDEGCATISDASGQLLFYTDGVTVYDRNHQIMPNGINLFGNSSSTQSATIIQKPGSVNLFYVITVDDYLGFKGLRYSIVDMNLNSGFGDITSEKNMLILAGATEKIAVVKKANETDYWIVSIIKETNQFYVFSLTNLGIDMTSPVINNIGNITNFANGGYLKFSPKGNKLVMCEIVSQYSQLFDFNNSTGIISNPIQINNLTNSTFPLIAPYGAEFSPNGKVLYISVRGFIEQYDLNATNVPNSVVYLPCPYAYSLQIGPNEKIYIAHDSSDSLSVIQNPNTLGTGANIDLFAVNLNGKVSLYGLPAFNQSFFNILGIQHYNTCESNAVNLNFNTNQTILSATWDFGDGNTSNVVSPTHTYSTSGTFPVSVTITTPQGTGSNTRDITIYPRPVLTNSTVTLKQCDDTNDGFSAFNLKEAENSFVASTTGLTFTYFENPTDAQNNNTVASITNPTAYNNQVVSTDVVYVRIENTNGCFRVGQLNLSVSTTSIPSSFQKVFTVCDDVLSGSNTDGIATFDFSSVTSQIQGLYPVGQLLTLKYYKNQADALAEQNAIVDISNYKNIDYPNTQNIYVRVDSQVNNDCLGLGHHITLNVERIPFIENLVLNHCDDNQDGSFGFDTTNLQTSLLNGLTNVSLTYKDQNGNTLPSPLSNPFVTTSQIITARATNNTTTACYDEATIQFIVDDLPEAFPIATTLTSACDDEVNPLTQDGLFSFNTSTFQATILGSQTGMIVNYYDENGVALSSPLPNPFTTDTQNITVEVINPINATCKAILNIPFIVKPTPKINTTGTELVCSNNPNFIKIIDAGLDDISTINDFTYQWFLDGNILTGETNYALTVNIEGSYTVVVTNAQNCSKTRTITVTASNIATIENISITDLSNNNSVIVTVSGSGDYEYSIDGENYQTSNTFYNLKSGTYTIYVKDNNGCGIAQEDISLLGIPKYFTPNADGYNDYWNIKGVSANYNAKTTIHIFDRYGKLLKQISPLSKGWDGTYNGKSMSSSDYWYVINLEDGRTFKGHFSLKR